MPIRTGQKSLLSLVSAAMMILIMSACNYGTQASTATPAASDTPWPTETFTPLPSPTTTPQPVGLAVVGPVETVFDWSEERCDENDIPDLPVRAFRDAEGNVQLITSHLLTRRMIGTDLNQLQRDCQPVMSSDHDPDPAAFNDNEWLASPFTEDGRTVYALVHNEYHGWEHSGLCQPPDHFPCWYNSITLARSTDGGDSYDHAASPPNHLVAALPDRYRAGAGPNGIFEPSNIVTLDDWYYAFIRIDETDSDQQRICVIRTQTLSEASSWRAWDGESFSVEFMSPYEGSEAISGTVPCAPVDPDSLGVMNQSITFNSYLGRYILVGITAIYRDGREVWGVLYSTSVNLLEWTDRQLLFEAELPWTYEPGDDPYLLYPSLIDPNSPARNFEVSGKTAYLFFTRFNQPDLEPLDRDLVRVPVEFFRTVAESAEVQLPFQIQP